MDGISAAILSLLHCSAAIKPVVAVRLARRGLAGQYPVLVGSLAVGAMLQAALLWSFWEGGWKAYGRMWAVITPMSFAVSIALTLEALSALARHFPNERNLCLLLLGVFGAISALTVLPLSMSLHDMLWLLDLRRHWKLVALAVLACARLFVGWVEPSMRSNVRHYVAGLLLCMAGSAMGDAIITAARPNYWGIAVGQFTLLLTPLAGYLRWWQMGQEGESYTPTTGPTLQELDGDLARIEGEIRAYHESAGS